MSHAATQSVVRREDSQDACTASARPVAQTHWSVQAEKQDKSFAGRGRCELAEEPQRRLTGVQGQRVSCTELSRLRHL